MSVQTTTQRLAAMYNAINGITRAFENIPRAILPAELPAVVIEPGAATYDSDTFGDNDVLETREYRATLFIDVAQFGTEKQGQVKVAPWFDTIRNYFLARPGLELDGETPPQVVVYNATLLGDNGFQIISYPTGGGIASEFAIIVFRHQVKEWASVAYQD